MNQSNHWLLVLLRQFTLQYRVRLPMLLVFSAIVTLVAMVLPVEMMPWERWVLLISSVAMLLACIDANAMLWRIYRQRGDLQSVRYMLLLLAIFIVLLTVGRMLGFASLFYEEVLSVVSIINLLSAALAMFLVLKSRTVEDYALGMPKLADLAAAHSELNEAVLQLAIRERNALEGMAVLSDDTITEANPEAYRIFGYDEARHELIGMRAHQLLHEDDNQKAYKALQENYSAPYTVRAICKDGSVKQLEATGTMMKRHDNLVRVVNFRDVTYERRYHELLGVQAVGDNTETLLRDLAGLRQRFRETTPINSVIPNAQ